MRARLLPALVALVALAVPATVAFPPIPPPKPGRGGKVDAKALEGTWAVVKYESGSAKAPSFTNLYKSVVIKGNNWAQVRAGKGKGKVPSGPSYTFTLDTTKSPPHIDMTMDDDKGKGKSSGARRGVLELKGDEPVVTYGMISKDVPRPVSPGAKLERLQYRWVLKREKK